MHEEASSCLEVKCVATRLRLVEGKVVTSTMLPAIAGQGFRNCRQRLPVVDRNGGKRWVRLTAHREVVQAGPLVLSGRIVWQGLAGSHVHGLESCHCYCFSGL